MAGSDDGESRLCKLHFAGSDENLGDIEGIAEDAFKVVEAMRIVG